MSSTSAGNPPPVEDPDGSQIELQPWSHNRYRCRDRPSQSGIPRRLLRSGKSSSVLIRRMPRALRERRCFWEPTGDWGSVGAVGIESKNDSIKAGQVGIGEQTQVPRVGGVREITTHSEKVKLMPYVGPCCRNIAMAAGIESCL